MRNSQESARILVNSQEHQVPADSLALRKWQVWDKVECPLARVTLRYFFENTSPEPLEVVYTMPMASDVLLDQFKIMLDDELVVSQLVPRETAETVYEEFFERGDFAVQLHMERSNVFTLNIGNLMPGAQLFMEIEATRLIEVQKNHFTLRIPTVIGPRYVPGVPTGGQRGMGWALPTDQVPDADFVTPPYQIEDVPYTVGAAFDISNNVHVESIESPSHPFKIEMNKNGGYRAILGESLSPDRDIILRVELSPRQSPHFWEYRYKNKILGALNVWGMFNQKTTSQPRKVTFLIDISGSMDGKKLETTLQAVKLCLRKLEPGDAIRLIAFESTIHPWKRNATWVELTDASLQDAERWLDRLHSMGGTEILPAIQQALMGKGAIGENHIIVLLTDGQVANEAEVQHTLRQSGFKGKMLLFGIDSAVNQEFFQGIQQFISATTHFIYPGEDIARAVNLQFENLRYPWIQNIRLRFKNGAVKSPLQIFTPMPFTLPVNSNRLIFFEAEDALTDLIAVELEGETDEKVVMPVEWGLEEFPAQHLFRFWARQIVEVQGMKQTLSAKELQEMAMHFKIPSRYTSWIATKILEEKADQPARIQVVPHQFPHGWSEDHFYFEKVFDAIIPRRKFADAQPLFLHREEHIMDFDEKVIDEPQLISRLLLDQRLDGAIELSGYSDNFISLAVLLWVLHNRLFENYPEYATNWEKLAHFCIGKESQFAPEEFLLWGGIVKMYSRELEQISGQKIVLRKPMKERVLDQKAMKKITRRMPDEEASLKKFMRWVGKAQQILTAEITKKALDH